MPRRYPALLGVLPLVLVGCLATEPHPPETVASVSFEPGPASAWITFTTVGGPDAVRVDVEDPAGNVQSVPADATNATVRVLLPFLSGDTAYLVRIVLTYDGAQAEWHGSFRTAPDPQAWATGASVTIQPGGPLAGGDCTLGFIVRDAQNQTLYALAAGHCTGGPGSPVNMSRPGDLDASFFIGHVVASEERPQESSLDWALVQIIPPLRPNVTSSVAYWSGPTPGPVGATPAPGAIVCLYGWGGLGDPDVPTRHRCGRLGSTEERSYAVTNYTQLWYDAQTFPGDSGAPVLAYATGQAVAVHVSRNPLRGGGGVHVDDLLDRIRAVAGLDLRVAQGVYDPPVVDPPGA